MQPAGVCCGLLASLTSSIAFVAIRKIQRAESALAVATWFYVSQFVMGAFALLVRLHSCASQRMPSQC